MRTPGPSATHGVAVRLRGKLGRYGFEVKSYDLGEARADARASLRTSVRCWFVGEVIVMGIKKAP